MKKVLITSVGRKIALLRAFKAHWSKEGVVYASDDNPLAVGLKEANTARLPLRVEDYDLIIPTRDAELAKFAGLRGCNSLETIETCTDKLKFFNHCTKHGFKTPLVYFVKPRVSYSGKETECVWQEFVDGEEYSIDMFTDFEGNVISAVPRKRIQVIHGESVITETVANDRLLGESVSLSKSLRLIGHHVLQAFIKDGSIIWLEANARFGGASIVGIEAGCNSPRFLWEIVNGETVKPRLGDYKVGLRGYAHTNWGFYEN